MSRCQLGLVILFSWLSDIVVSFLFLVACGVFIWFQTFADFSIHRLGVYGAPLYEAVKSRWGEIGMDSYYGRCAYWEF